MFHVFEELRLDLSSYTYPTEYGILQKYVSGLKLSQIGPFYSYPFIGKNITCYNHMFHVVDDLK